MDTKSYSTLREADPIDWNAFLLKKMSEVSLEEMRSMRNAAGDWVTCACGNQCAVIPRNPIGSPKDEQLASLGLSFFDHIQAMYSSKCMEFIRSLNDTNIITNEFDGNRVCAKGFLLQIEQRSIELIKEINDRLKYELV